MLDAAVATANLPVKDLSRARRFYEETLGFAESGINPAGGVDLIGDGGERHPRKATVYYQAGGGTVVQLYETDVEPPASTVVGFLVRDFDAEIADLRQRGVAFEEYDFPEMKTENGVYSDPSGFRASWFKDPDGNVLGVRSY